MSSQFFIGVLMQHANTSNIDWVAFSPSSGSCVSPSGTYRDHYVSYPPHTQLLLCDHVLPPDIFPSPPLAGNNRRPHFYSRNSREPTPTFTWMHPTNKHFLTSCNWVRENDVLSRGKDILHFRPEISLKLQLSSNVACTTLICGWNMMNRVTLAKLGQTRTIG